MLGRKFMASQWFMTNPMPKLPYVVEIEGRTYMGYSVEKLLEQRLAVLLARNTQPPLEWDEEVWKALARAYPKHVRRQRGRNRPGINIIQARADIKFLIRRLGKSKLVSPDLAKARAARCRVCPLRAEVMGCSVCKQVLSIHVHPPEKVEAPESCKACGCYLPLKVWVPRALLGSADDFPYASKCWMRSEDPPS